MCLCISPLVLFMGCSKTETHTQADYVDASSLGGKSEGHAARPASSADLRAAAAYLDQREAWWTTWSGSARDHQTFCVSCHTAVPYALSRYSLRGELGENEPTIDERKLIEDVTKRVRLWKEIEPSYSDQEYGEHKATQSRGTEAVLNVLILAAYDAQSGKLSAGTKMAFSNMWALQLNSGEEKGSWSWLQFDMEPWEARDSPYYGATLAALAIGLAPENYGANPEIQENLKLLREYLSREYASQPLINRVELLWAAEKLPGILEAQKLEALIREILSKQQADGGWSLSQLAGTWKGWRVVSLVGRWRRDDGSPQEVKSDGYATGLIVFALQEAGVSRENAQLKQGLSWLQKNQDAAGGFWPGYSLNRKRNPTSGPGQFMNDAATAYAVLALTEAKGPSQQAIKVQAKTGVNE